MFSFDKTFLLGREPLFNRASMTLQNKFQLSNLISCKHAGFKWKLSSCERYTWAHLWLCNYGLVSFISKKDLSPRC